MTLIKIPRASRRQRGAIDASETRGPGAGSASFQRDWSINDGNGLNITSAMYSGKRSRNPAAERQRPNQSRQSQSKYVPAATYQTATYVIPSPSGKRSRNCVCAWEEDRPRMPPRAHVADSGGHRRLGLGVVSQERCATQRFSRCLVDSE